MKTQIGATTKEGPVIKISKNVLNIIISIVVTVIILFLFFLILNDRSISNKNKLDQSETFENKIGSISEEIKSSKVFSYLPLTEVTSEYFDSKSEECYESCTLKDLVLTAISQMDTLRSYKYEFESSNTQKLVSYVQNNNQKNLNIFSQYFSNNVLYEEEKVLDGKLYNRTKTEGEWGKFKETKVDMQKIFDNVSYKRFFNKKDEFKEINLVIDLSQASKTVSFKHNDGYCFVTINKSFVITKIECIDNKNTTQSAKFSYFNTNFGEVTLEENNLEVINTDTKIIERIVSKIKEQLGTKSSYSVYSMNTDENAKYNLLEGKVISRDNNNLNLEYTNFLSRNLSEQTEISTFGNERYTRKFGDDEKWSNWKNESINDSIEQSEIKTVLNQELFDNLSGLNINNIYDFKITPEFGGKLYKINLILPTKNNLYNGDFDIVSVFFDYNYYVTRVEVSNYSRFEFVRSQTTDYWPIYEKVKLEKINS